MIIDFDIISNESKLWIYGSDKNLSFKQQNYILKNISKYLKEWKYHNNPLTSAVTILENRFLIVALDDTEHGVGGCSIDSLQRIIIDLEQQLDISLLNRLNVFCKIGDDIRCVPTFRLKEIANGDTYFFDLTIQKKFQIDSYLKPINQGWCSQYV